MKVEKGNTGLVKELVETGGYIFDVKISDIRSYNEELWNSMNHNYKEAFPHICNSVRNFFKLKVNPEDAVKVYLVKLVI